TVGGVVAAFAFFTTTGRHFENAPLRAAVVSGLGIASAIGSSLVLARIARLEARQRALAPFLLGAVALATWLADALLLRGLYPAFHTALFTTLVFTLGLLAAEARLPRSRPFHLGVVLLGLLPGSIA